MPDMWFVFGIALGTIVTGFCAVGSFDRGTDSARRKSWSLGYAARTRALAAPLAASRTKTRPNATAGLAEAKAS